MNELLTPAEMGRADTLAMAGGVAGVALMERAGWAVARAARRFGPCRVLVLCGPGNNGGDGYVAARLLAAQGWPVRVAALASPRPGTDAAAAVAAWSGPSGAFEPAEAARADLVIDAVFGAGLSRAVEGTVADTLAAARRILAVDVPSGVDGTTGAVRGRAAQAVCTVTFFRLKPGHCLLPGRDLCGETVLADIGLPARVLADIRPQTVRNTPALWRLPALPASTHKYARGFVSVLGGARMTGAAQLAAAAARHGGAGMVTIVAPGHAALYSHVPAGLIVNDEPLETVLQDARRTTWVCGPGLGQDAARAALPRLLAAGRQVVADADALSAHAGRPEALRGAAVLTPHEGEFTKLFGPPGDDRLSAARAAARLVGTVVLLKGSDTVIAAPDGRAAINGTRHLRPGHGRGRRRALRPDRRLARRRHASVGGGLCRGVAARSRGGGARPGAGCRGPPGRDCRGRAPSPWDG